MDPDGARLLATCLVDLSVIGGILALARCAADETEHGLSSSHAGVRRPCAGRGREAPAAGVVSEARADGAHLDLPGHVGLTQHLLGPGSRGPALQPLAELH